MSKKKQKKQERLKEPAQPNKRNLPCCNNPDWTAGFLMNHCKNCGTNDY